jgi:hypothetical protein
MLNTPTGTAETGLSLIVYAYRPNTLISVNT